MDVYLDDCSDSDRLVAFLAAAGHGVENPRSARTAGSLDPEHLEYAAAYGLALITRNARDFRLLHAEWQSQGRSHSGILLVYRDNIKGKDMEPADIIRAIS